METTVHTGVPKGSLGDVQPPRIPTSDSIQNVCMSRILCSSCYPNLTFCFSFWVTLRPLARKFLDPFLRFASSVKSWIRLRLLIWYFRFC